MCLTEPVPFTHPFRLFSCAVGTLELPKKGKISVDHEHNSENAKKNKTADATQQRTIYRVKIYITIKQIVPVKYCKQLYLISTITNISSITIILFTGCNKNCFLGNYVNK